MNRRTAIRQLTTFFLTTASLAQAQQAKKVPRIGYLSLAAKPSPRDEAFVQGLRDLGWVDGQNIAIEYRWATGKPESLAALADELVSMKVDIIVAPATPAVTAAKNATKTIPIVMIAVADAVGSGFVASLAQPGGNITGTTNILPELASKRLGLLKEILPKLSRVTFLAYGPDPAHKLFVKEAQDAVQSFKMRFQPLVLAGVEEIEGAFAAMKKERAGALIVQPLFISALGQGPRIAELAAKNRIPTISDGFQFAEQGGLMFYGPDSVAVYRNTANFVDKILKGRKPADLPVEQPMKFDFVINLQTAKKIGVDIKQSVLFRASKVIK
ncbi:MAG: ABC transporter substrate-binding protein [Deltaproteobacteria bacterium]|nr:ABC transporter substrate-binding protein [Deltaproteobacteria bacterium]